MDHNHVNIWLLQSIEYEFILICSMFTIYNFARFHLELSPLSNLGNILKMRSKSIKKEYKEQVPSLYVAFDTLLEYARG